MEADCITMTGANPRSRSPGQIADLHLVGGKLIQRLVFEVQQDIAGF